MPDPQDDATREAHVFARYLVGRTPPAGAVARYRDARRAIWGDGAAADPVLAFARRHPWSVAPLDAVSCLLEPGGTLHAAILTMAAILEASPQFADDFLPRSVSRAELLWRVLAAGTVTAVEVLAGVLLLPLARRART